MKKQTRLEIAEKNYIKAKRRLAYLIKKLPGLSKELKVPVFVKIDEARYQMKIAKMIFIGERLKAAASSFVQEIKDLPPTKSEHEAIITKVNITPMAFSLKESFQHIELDNKMTLVAIDNVLGEIKEICQELFQDTNDETD